MEMQVRLSKFGKVRMLRTVTRNGVVNWFLDEEWIGIERSRREYEETKRTKRKAKK